MQQDLRVPELSLEKAILDGVAEGNVQASGGDAGPLRRLAANPECRTGRRAEC
jgi:hypothetical protein